MQSRLVLSSLSAALLVFAQAQAGTGANAPHRGPSCIVKRQYTIRCVEGFRSADKMVTYLDTALHCQSYRPAWPGASCPDKCEFDPKSCYNRW